MDLQRTTPLAAAAAALAAVFASGCVDNTIRALPNRPPVAQALIDNGDADVAQQRLGYVILDESAFLDGSLSDDPDDPGQPDLLTFRWSFDSLPAESALTAEDIVVPEDDPETGEVNESAFPSFTPDALGTYRVQLVVVDTDDAESDPAVVIVQAVPPGELSVTLEWSETQADLDLHLLGPGGAYFGDGDCFSWNPNPDWGSPDLATDNPELADDADGEGSGPYRETITLDLPPDGDYEVWVHYYSDHSAELGHTAVPATPTVAVSVFGEGLDGGTMTAGTPLVAGDVWIVGVLGWPERSFSQLDQRSDHASQGGPPYND